MQIIHDAWNTGYPHQWSAFFCFPPMRQSTESDELVVRAFKKAGLGLALDGSEDDQVCPAMHDEVIAAHVQTIEPCQ